MRELDCQSLIIDAVRAQGGAAHKLSNRFLVGVSDLLVKLPKYPAALFEVKLAKFSMKISDGHDFMPDLTKLQEDFLLGYARAGMACGLLSFVQRGNDRRGLHMAQFKIDPADRSCYRRGDHVRVGQHTSLGGHDVARRAHIVTRLENIHDGGWTR